MARKAQSENTTDLISRVDCKLEIYQEKLCGNGEDAYVFSINEERALIGAFDGCGGAGAKQYRKLQGKTGAYIASRVAAATVKEWFNEAGEAEGDISQSMKAMIRKNLRLCSDVGAEESKLVSSMVKTLPTTAAIALIQEENAWIRVDYLWAGDSRVYLLNADGLAQLSVDDLSVPDAMKNLYEDGVMTNVISLSKDFKLHHGTLYLDKPGIIITATDGCYGYLSTPMEFEYLLIHELMAAPNVAQWEHSINKALAQVAGDDYTLVAAALDFGSFSKMQQTLFERERELYRGFIKSLSGSDLQKKMDIWDRYKDSYYRYHPKQDR